MEAAGVPELRAAQESAVELSTEAARPLVVAMHASMLRSVDLMGVGGNTPQQHRQDTVAEDVAALGSAPPLPNPRTPHACQNPLLSCPRRCPHTPKPRAH